jgi:hypothetical protein
MALGPESVPMPNEIVMRDGVLRLGPSDQAMGAAVLWDAGAPGEMLLETTRLQSRARPHNLNVELARFRLMRMLQKIEDWGLFDLPAAQDLVTRVRDLQKQFGGALENLADGAVASTLADEVLAKSITLGDELVLFNADLTLTRRKTQNSFARYVFGCRVDWTLRNQKVKDLLADNFDYAVLPMTWKLLQPKEDAFDTAAMDEWVEYLTRRRVPIIAGPIIQLDEASMPDWAYMWENDIDVLRDLMIDFVRKMVTRYRRAVAVWNVVGGLHANSIPGLGFEQTIELTRLLVAQVKSMLPQARTLVGIRDPFGEHHATKHPGVPPMLYADTIAQAGVNCDGFALEIEQGVPRVGGYTRDLFQLSCVIDKLSGTGKPLYVTAISAPSRTTPDSGDGSEGAMDPSKAGRWRGPWTPDLQADWLESVSKIALGKPFVESVTWGNLTDANASVPGGGLVDEMFRPKPAFERIKTLRQAYQRKDKKA